MTSVTRRGFFGRLAAVAVGAVAAMRAKPAEVADHWYHDPDPELVRRVMDRKSGISMRFVGNWDQVASKMVNRIDMVHGDWLRQR